MTHSEPLTDEAICRLHYAYDDRVCALPLGHDDPDHHMSANGFHWLHNEVLVAGLGEGYGEEIWDIWDEPIDRLNGART